MATNKLKTNINKEFNRSVRRERRELELKYERWNEFTARVVRPTLPAKWRVFDKTADLRLGGKGRSPRRIFDKESIEFIKLFSFIKVYFYYTVLKQSNIERTTQKELFPTGESSIFDLWYYKS